MLHRIYMVGVLWGGLVLSAPLAWAQDPKIKSEPQKPIPPLGAEETPSAAQRAAEGQPPSDEPNILPDLRPLAGAQNLTFGLIGLNRSFLVPSFSVVTQAGTNAYGSNQANSSGVLNTNYLTGRLRLNRTSGRSELLLNYLAGATLSNDPNLGNSAIQDLGFVDTTRWGRWSVLFGDQFSYLSESSFGFGGLGGLDSLGMSSGNGFLGATVPAPSFRPDLLPNQTIITSRAPRISNAALFQTNYDLSRRSSLTFLGSYGMLKFVDAGFQNGSNALFQGGYSHILNRKDSIGILYRFNQFMFSKTAERIRDHSVQLLYARRIASRLIFQIGAGPEVDTFETPRAGPGTLLNWTLSGALNSQYRHTALGFNFSRFLTGGSGVLLGAKTDQFQGQLSRTFSRDWDGSISLGYSKNEALEQTTSAANSIAPDTWFLTSRVSRHFARGGSLFFTYTVWRQSSLARVCTAPACGFNALAHTGSIGYTWGFRPIMIE